MHPHLNHLPQPLLLSSLHQFRPRHHRWHYWPNVTLPPVLVRPLSWRCDGKPFVPSETGVSTQPPIWYRFIPSRYLLCRFNHAPLNCLRPEKLTAPFPPSHLSQLLLIVALQFPLLRCGTHCSTSPQQRCASPNQT